jgi:hypothetical protein
MNSRFIVILTAAALLGLTSCDSLPSVVEVRQHIDANLKPGDPESKVVAFLKQSGWLFGWDRFNRRYQATYGKTSKNIIGVERGIGIYIYLNDDRSYLRAEVENVYTYF